MLLVNAFGNKARPGSLMLEARRELEVIASELAQEARDAVYKQRFKQVPLTPRYLARKIRKGLDPRIWIATKKLVKSIGWVKTEYGARIGVRRGYRLDTYTRKDGSVVTRKLEYWKLLLWLEYGTKKMPPRPVFRRLIRAWRDQRKKYGLRIKRKMGYELKRLVKELK